MGHIVSRSSMPSKMEDSADQDPEPADDSDQADDPEQADNPEPGDDPEPADDSAQADDPEQADDPNTHPEVNPDPDPTESSMGPAPRTHIRYGGDGNPGRGLSCGDIILDSLRRLQHETRPAQVNAHLGTVLSFRELLVQTVFAAEGWRALGLQPGDVVALVSRNHHEVFTAVLGAVCAGLSVACITPSATTTEMQHALSVARPKVVLSESARLARALQAAPAGVLHMVLNGEAPEGPDGPGGVDSFLSLLRRGEAVDPPPDVDTYRAVDVGDRSQSTPFVLFSSGTTGLPKGVRLRDSALALLVDNLSNLYPNDGSDSVLLISSPLCWVTGVWQCLNGVVFGLTRVFTTVSDEITLLSAIDKYQVKTWLAAPAVLIAMLSLHRRRYQHRYSLRSLTRVLTGGSAMSTTVQDSLRAELGCQLIQAYGATEAGFVFGPDYGSDGTAGSLGKLRPWVELRLVSLETGEDVPTSSWNVVGEVLVRSPYVMHSYANNPEETAKAFDELGFYRTGDLAYEAEDGSYYFVDRIKEMIKYKNNQIAPAEVEMVVLQHPGVREACVLGRASTADIGDVPMAFVARAVGSDVTAEEIMALVAGALSDYKQLRGGVVFMDQLPKTVSGKVARHKLKEMLRTM